MCHGLGIFGGFDLYATLNSHDFPYDECTLLDLFLAVWNTEEDTMSSAVYHSWSSHRYSTPGELHFPNETNVFTYRNLDYRFHNCITL